jgi:hypothetical protein
MRAEASDLWPDWGLERPGRMRNDSPDECVREKYWIRQDANQPWLRRNLRDRM